MPKCKDCEPIVGVWYQPISKMDQWKALGVNTLVGIEKENPRFTQAQVRAAAAAKGLKYIDVPSASIAADQADPNLIAWLLPDEPDFHTSPVSSWSNVANAIRTAGGTKPIFGNFSGPHVTAAFPAYQGQPSQKWAGHKAFIPYADWLSHDWYPINTEPNRYWTPFNGPGLITRAMDLLDKWSNGKPQLAFVECGYINKSAPGRSPTCDEMKQIVRAIWNHPSALGYIFFPDRDSGDRGGGAGYQSFTFDNTTPDMRVCMADVIDETTPKAAAPTVVYELLSNNTWRVKA